MIRVLFVCVENSCRSQMAEAFARMHGGGAIEPYSAGSKPSGVVNPKAIASMALLGYNLSTHRSKSLQEVPREGYDHVITMGCGDECPFIPARARSEWDIPDPKDMAPDAFAKVRDEIERRVKELIDG
jgi:arsenate reductase